MIQYYWEGESSFGYFSCKSDEEAIRKFKQIVKALIMYREDLHSIDGFPFWLSRGREFVVANEKNYMGTRTNI